MLDLVDVWFRDIIILEIGIVDVKVVDGWESDVNG